MSELDSLVKWLGTLGVSGVDASVNGTAGSCANKVAALADGVLIADCLAQIAPNHFNSDFLAKIKREDLVDYRLKATNLKKVVQFVYSYYQEVLFQELSDDALPDENRIAADVEPEEVVKLLRLVLGCAINCDHKEKYIGGIMSLEENIQHDVMNAIQLLMSSQSESIMANRLKGLNSPNGIADGSEDENQHVIDRQLKEAWDEVHRLTMENEELSQKYHDIQMKIDYMNEEKDLLLSQLEALNGANQKGKKGVKSSALKSSGSSGGAGAESTNDSGVANLDDSIVSSPIEELAPAAILASKKYKQLQEQYDELTHENYRLEAMKDDFKGRCEEQEQEIMDLQEKISEMSELAKNARKFKDEVDELQYEIGKASKLESQVETLKAKCEEMGDLKRQIKLLEEKNTSYVQNNLQLEEETKKLGTLRQQIENYRLQMQKLETELIRESKRADRAEFDLAKKTEKLANLESEIEKLRQVKLQMQEEMDEISGMNASTTHILPKSGRQASSPMATADPECSVASSIDSPRGSVDIARNGIELLPPHIQELITRLTHENRMLKRSLNDAPETTEKIELLKNELEDEQRRRADLESENRLANGKLMELESRLEESQSMLDKSNSAGDVSSQQMTEMRKKLHEYMDKARVLEGESEKHKLSSESLQCKLKESEERHKTVKDLLAKKEHDMNLMERRYQEYVEKAKSVVRNLDSRKQPPTPEVQTLKNQLKDKEKMIQQLERERDKSRVVRDEEEKLILSAWYNLGGQLHRVGTDARLANSAVAGGASAAAQQSFLSHHRSRNAAAFSSNHSGRPPTLSYVTANSAAAGPMSHTGPATFQPNSSFVTEQHWIEAQQILPGGPSSEQQQQYLNQSEHILNAMDLIHLSQQHQHQSGGGQNGRASAGPTGAGGANTGAGGTDPAIYPQFYMRCYENPHAPPSAYDSRPTSVPYPPWSSDNNNLFTHLDPSLFYPPVSADYMSSGSNGYSGSGAAHLFNSSAAEHPMDNYDATLTRRPRGSRRNTHNNRHYSDLQLPPTKDLCNFNNRPSSGTPPSWVSASEQTAVGGMN